MDEAPQIIPQNTSVAAVISPEAPIKKRRGRPPKKVVLESDTQPAPVAERPAVRKVAKVITPVEGQRTTPVAVSTLQYIFSVGRRKRAVARIFLYREGTGEIEINKKPITQYFPGAQLQEVATQSLAYSPFKNSVRIVANVRGGGIQGQADAVCLGIAHALLKLDASLRPTLRARGLLTRDSREKERKKPGLKKARRAPQWQKR